MGRIHHVWKCRLAFATFALACMSEWVAAAPPPPPTNLIPPAEQPRQKESPPAEVEAKPDAAGNAKTGSRVSAHVWTIEFKTSSKDAPMEFGQRLGSELFKLTVAGKSGGFLTSDELAAVIKEFRHKGKVVIHEEKPHVIRSGETAKWGDMVTTWIQVTPTLLPEGKLQLSTATEVKKGLDSQSAKVTITVDPEQTLMVGGAAVNQTRTETLRVPWLSDDPKVGKWFRYPLTWTVGECRLFFVSTAIVPEGDTQGGSD